MDMNEDTGAQGQEAGTEASATQSSAVEKPVEQPRGMRAAFEEAKREVEGASKVTQNNDAKVADATPQSIATPQKEAVVPAPSEVSAPQHWTAERKAVFERLDPEAKTAWLESDKDWQRGLNEKTAKLKPAAEVFDVVNNAITPQLRAEMKERNISETQVVTALINMGRELETNPAAFIAKTMQRHRIDPRMFLPNTGGQQQQSNGNIQQILPVIQPLLSKVEELERGQRAWQQKQYEEASKATETTISSFSQEKDATGAPKYPYLEKVVDTMVDLIENNPRYSGMEAHQLLEHAYNTAVALDPVIRAELIAAEASKKQLAVQQSSQTSRLNSAATVKPVASTPGSKAAPKGLRGAYEAAKAQMRQT